MATLIQLEEKQHKTPWQIGGTPRVNGVCTYDLPDSLPENFGVGVMFRPYRSSIAGAWGYIFTLRGSGTDSIRLSNAEHADHTLTLWVYEGGSYSHAYLGGCEFAAGEVAGVYIARHGSDYEVYYRTLLLQKTFSRKITDHSPQGLNKIYIGTSLQAPYQHLNAEYLNLAIHTQPGTIDAEDYFNRPIVTSGGA